MDSKEKIISAAIEVFAEKGKHGARMEEIAAKAGINKAMPYYFYTTKENLYIEVLAAIFREISKHIQNGIEQALPKASSYADKIKVIVQSHFEAYSFNVNYTRVMLEAMATQQDDMKKAIALSKKADAAADRRVITPEKFRAFIEKGISEGVLRKVDPEQLLISIIGMNLIHFISQPIAHAFAECGISDNDKFIMTRQESIIDVLLNGILAKGNA